MKALLHFIELSNLNWLCLFSLETKESTEMTLTIKKQASGLGLEIVGGSDTYLVRLKNILVPRASRDPFDLRRGLDGADQEDRGSGLIY